VFRQSPTDAGGEIRRVAGGVCALSYVAASSQICERQVRVDLAAFIEKLIEVPVSEQSPVQATASANVLYMVAYGRRAVLRQRVVPSRMVGEPIYFFEVVNQQRPGPRGRSADAI